MSDIPLPTRKEFLMAVAAGALLPAIAPAESEPAPGKLLIVNAHPDDEYACAGAVYRLAREHGWVADQVVITDGESGYRYAALAEAFYGASFQPDDEGRARLAEIREEEARRAGKILGIRRHYFLEQRDLGFDTDAASADTVNWDRAYIRAFLTGLLSREKYDAVFTLLPTAETHGHHRVATLLTLDAATRLSGPRPLLFGADPRDADVAPPAFPGLAGEPLTRTVSPAPSLVFDRDTSFGYRNALTYHIVVNWLVAEHKTQGLFQTDSGKHRFEQFWLFEASGADARARLATFQNNFQTPGAPLTAQKGTSK